MPIWSANGTAGKMGARRPGQLAKNDNDLAEANKQQVSPIARSMMLRWSTSAFGGQRGLWAGHSIKTIDYRERPARSSTLKERAANRITQDGLNHDLECNRHNSERGGDRVRAGPRARIVDCLALSPVTRRQVLWNV
jgi:hypothetical protein